MANENLKFITHEDRMNYKFTDRDDLRDRIAGKTIRIKDELFFIKSRINGIQEKLVFLENESKTDAVLRQVNAREIKELKEELEAQFNEYVRIRNNELLCYTEEEVIEKQNNFTSYDLEESIYGRILRESKDRETEEISKDIKLMELSMQDQKLDYELNYDEFKNAEYEANKVIRYAETVESLGTRPNVDNIVKNLNQLTPEEINKIESILQEIKEDRNLSMNKADIDRITKEHIAKHPISYAIFKAKNMVNEIASEIRDARNAIKEAENTLDSIDESASIITKDNSVANNVAMSTIRNSYKSISDVLKEAYTRGSEMLEKGTSTLKEIGQNLLMKADKCLEFVSCGALSQSLNIEVKNNDSLLSKVINKSKEFVLNTRGKENIAEYQAELKSVWKDSKSPIEYTSEKLNNAKDNLISAKKKVFDFVSNTKDNVLTKCEIAMLNIYKDSLELQNNIDRSILRHYEKTERTTESKLNKLNSNLKQEIYSYKEMEKETQAMDKSRESNVKDVSSDKLKEINSALASIKQLNNSGVKENFVVNMLEREAKKEEKKIKVFNTLNDIENKIDLGVLKITNKMDLTVLKMDIQAGISAREDLRERANNIKIKLEKGNNLVENRDKNIKELNKKINKLKGTNVEPIAESDLTKAEELAEIELEAEEAREVEMEEIKEDREEREDD